MELFDSHAFGQVAGLVNVTAAFHGDIISQELERDYR